MHYVEEHIIIYIDIKRSELFFHHGVRVLNKPLWKRSVLVPSASVVILLECSRR